MNKENIIVILVIIIILLIAGGLISHTSNKTNQCHDLGGIYMEGQCFKAELIKLN